jgi:hypothetical protein
MLALLGWGSGCGTSGTPKSRRTPEPSPQHRAPAELAELPRIISEVSRIRGLAPLRHTRSMRLQIAEWRATVAHRLANSSSFASFDSVWKALKFIEVSDSEQSPERPLLAETTAFYDRRRKVIVAAPEASSDSIAHEACHALQDQHFDLSRILAVDSIDAYLARLAVIEGDALLVSLVWRSGPEIVQRGRLMPPPPSHWRGVAREIAAFPYEAGLTFVLDLVQTFGWERVNDEFSRPPSSTAQVLHPHRYSGSRAHQQVHPIRATLPPGTVEDRSMVVGEFLLDAWLRRHSIEPALSRSAADGWDGDLLNVFVFAKDARDDIGANAPAFIWRLHWRSEGDAAEFAGTLPQVLASLANAVVRTDARDGIDIVQVIATDGTTYRAETQGSATLIVGGLPQTVAESISNEVWSSWIILGASGP